MFSWFFLWHNSKTLLYPPKGFILLWNWYWHEKLITKLISGGEPPLRDTARFITLMAFISAIGREELIDRFVSSTPSTQRVSRSRSGTTQHWHGFFISFCGRRDISRNRKYAADALGEKKNIHILLFFYLNVEDFLLPTQYYITYWLIDFFKVIYSISIQELPTRTKGWYKRFAYPNLLLITSCAYLKFSFRSSGTISYLYDMIL